MQELTFELQDDSELIDSSAAVHLAVNGELSKQLYEDMCSFHHTVSICKSEQILPPKYSCQPMAQIVLEVSGYEKHPDIKEFPLNIDSKRKDSAVGDDNAGFNLKEETLGSPAIANGQNTLKANSDPFCESGKCRVQEIHFQLLNQHKWVVKESRILTKQEVITESYVVTPTG